MKKKHNKTIPHDLLLKSLLTNPEFARGFFALLEQLVSIFQAIESAKEGNFFLEIILYLFKSLDMEPKDFKDHIKKYQGQIKTDVMTLYDQLIKEGFEQGRQEGRQEGVKEGIEAKTQEVVVRGFANGISIPTLVLLTGLTEKDIHQILQQG